MTRRWTPDVVHGPGSYTMTMKRACNGCGRRIGDATDAEVHAAVAGRPLPDVTVECGCAPRRPDYVYVASSWRCAMQPAVIAALAAAGIDHYDFRHPPGGAGFGWGEVMPSFSVDEQLADVDEYLAALNHRRSEQGFQSDFVAMQRADTFVLVLPCGRSAHLELGWAVGAGKRTAILLDPDPTTGAVVPELMYKMVDLITPDMMDLLAWLGVED